MIRQIEDDQDERVVRDGERVHVSLFAMDAIQRQVAASSVQVVDAYGQPAGHRPGHLYPGSANQQDAARMKAYDDYCGRIRDAWRTPSPSEQVRK